MSIFLQFTMLVNAVSGMMHSVFRQQKRILWDIPQGALELSYQLECRIVVMEN